MLCSTSDKRLKIYTILKRRWHRLSVRRIGCQSAGSSILVYCPNYLLPSKKPAQSKKIQDLNLSCSIAFGISRAIDVPDIWKYGELAGLIIEIFWLVSQAHQIRLFIPVGAVALQVWIGQLTAWAMLPFWVIQASKRCSSVIDWQALTWPSVNEINVSKLDSTLVADRNIS